jgi:hypothetical protein
MNMHTTIEEPVSKQRISKHTRIGVLLETVFSILSEQSGSIESQSSSGVPSEQLVKSWDDGVESSCVVR